MCIPNINVPAISPPPPPPLCRIWTTAGGCCRILFVCDGNGVTEKAELKWSRQCEMVKGTQGKVFRHAKLDKFVG